MKYVRPGWSGLEVSRLCLGTMNMGTPRLCPDVPAFAPQNAFSGPTALWLQAPMVFAEPAANDVYHRAFPANFRRWRHRPVMPPPLVPQGSRSLRQNP